MANSTMTDSEVDPSTWMSLFPLISAIFEDIDLLENPVLGGRFDLQRKKRSLYRRFSDNLLVYSWIWC